MDHSIELRDRLAPTELVDQFNILLNRERSSLRVYENDPEYGSGYLPSVTLDGCEWYEYARKIMSEKGSLAILELGAGDDAAAWTGGKKARVSQGKQAIVDHIFAAHITVQSESGLWAEWACAQGVNTFVTGHFFDVLSQMVREKRQFDLILSRFVLNQSMVALEALWLIDRLLSSHGAAFMDAVSQDEGVDIMIFPRDGMPKIYIDWLDLGKSLNFKTADVAGLAWQRQNGVYNVAWKKGQFDQSRLPKLVSILPLGFETFGSEEKLIYALL
ncbi:hypothetical protein HY408_02110 [Candidatus Gottesmanbacteria bacterium]|nr:hypothetical protein [Candidatus Gottesmanbacteria bacterium]